jgi:outer membrane lipopolysaccharide assembly protein LptE/RlpB
MPRVGTPLLLAAALVATGACGYALAGRGNALPADVRIIGVPDLVNESTYADIDGVLTRALREELQSKGRYVVRPEAAGADAVLTGRVMSVVFQPVAFTGEGQAQRLEVTVTAAIEFRDTRRDQVLWSNPSFSGREEFPLTTGTTANDPEALFRQDASALERIARSVARTVVTSIFEAF